MLGLVVGQMYGWSDGWVDEWVELRWMKGQTNIQGHLVRQAVRQRFGVWLGGFFMGV